MSGYNELIKDYEIMRELIRQYFAFGVDSRTDYMEKGNQKSRIQGYDVQRLQSWLGAYLDSYVDDKGRRIYYFAVSGRSVLQNPLFRTYLSKTTATSRQTRLFFYALAVLSDGKPRKLNAIGEDMRMLFNDATAPLRSAYSDALCSAFDFHEDTLRTVLDMYAKLGVFEVQGKGSRAAYRLKQTDISLAPFKDALYFASEQDPIGVPGFYLLNRIGEVPKDIRFKHHYFLNVLNSGYIYELFDAMQQHSWVSIRTDSQPEHPITVYPLKLYLSVQNGRQHLLCYDRDWKKPCFLRIDRIRDVAPVPVADVCPLTGEALTEFESHLWGVGYFPERSRDLKHLELTVCVAENEPYIDRRLERETRCASLEKLPDTQRRIRADVYDTPEVFPWLFSLIGRIEDVACSDPTFAETFAKTLENMSRLYEEADALPEAHVGNEPGRASSRPARKATKPLRIFHEIYGTYYAAAAAFLRRLGGKSCSSREAQKILGDLLRDSFDDIKINLLTIMKEDWMLLIENPEDKTLFSPIKKLPPFPLTTPELRWMKTVFADPRVSLFLPEEGVPALDGVEPLYTPDQVVYYDRYTDSDSFTDPKYRARFRIILQAIREHKKLGICYISTNTNQEQYREMRPLYLEYSEKDDKFRLIGEAQGPHGRAPMQIRLSTILHCETLGAFLPEENVEEEERQIELILFDARNALERVLLHFSDLKKRTERINDRTYRVELTYRKSEEREMIMRILSFGALLKVVSPDPIRDEIAARILRQQALWEERNLAQTTITNKEKENGAE